MSLVENTSTLVGNYAPDFELPGIDNRVHHLSRYLDQWKGVGVVFLSNCCPYISSYIDRLKQIQAQFHDQGFTLVAINANDPIQSPQDSFENMKQFAHQQQLNFPYLWDPTQDVAQCFGTRKTSEVFVIDEQGIVRYGGGIDDSPQQPDAVQEPYLKNAIVALLEGKEITPKLTEAVGSELKWRH